MSESSIQTGLQAAIQSMFEFADADVVINDWSILDNSNANAPYVIIENADEFTSRQDVMTPVTKWSEKITLIEKFEDWDTTLNGLRTRRQAIIDKINTGEARSAGVLEAVTIDEISSGGPIGYIYNRYIPDEQINEELPAFLSQLIILACEEY